MPVALKNIRDTLLPGLQQWRAQNIALGYAITRKAIDDNLYNNIFAEPQPAIPGFTLEELEQARDFIAQIEEKG